MITARRKLLACSVLAAWSVLLTALTGVLGGIPLRGFRLAAGGWAYWTVSLTAGVGLVLGGWWFLAALFMSLVTVVGIYTDLEDRGYSLSASGFASVIITSLGLAGGFGLWAAVRGPTWPGVLVNQIETYLNSIPGWTEKIQIEAKDIVAQLPSLTIVSLMIGLFLALLFQKRIMSLAGMARIVPQHLSRFAVPDFFIWTLIASLAGIFLGRSHPWAMAVGVNLLNVSAVVFFFQGLAVVTTFLRALRVSWIWQTLVLVIFVTQLFVLVSAIGLVDYWMDFRLRLNRRRQQQTEREILKK